MREVMNEDSVTAMVADMRVFCSDIEPRRIRMVQPRNDEEIVEERHDRVNNGVDERAARDFRWAFAPTAMPVSFSHVAD
jgi:hypothetical protein